MMDRSQDVTVCPPFAFDSHSELLLTESPLKLNTNLRSRPPVDWNYVGAKIVVTSRDTPKTVITITV
jgi:hypothetical protein